MLGTKLIKGLVANRSTLNSFYCQIYESWSRSNCCWVFVGLISLEETLSWFKHLKFSVFVSQSLAWFVGVIRSCVLSYCCLIMSSCVAMWIFPEDAFKLVLHLVWQSILIDLYLMTTILLPKEIMIVLLRLQEDFKTVRHSLWWRHSKNCQLCFLYTSWQWGP